MTVSTHHLNITRQNGERVHRRLGGPFAVLTIVLAAWVSGRAILWESPAWPDLELAPALLAEGPSDFPSVRADDGLAGVEATSWPGFEGEAAKAGDLRSKPALALPFDRAAPSIAGSSGFASGQRALAHQFLWRAALSASPNGASWRKSGGGYDGFDDKHWRGPVFPGSPPLEPRARSQQRPSKAERWSLDAWIFGRDGAANPRVAPGPAPVYGASQMGGILRFHAAPSRWSAPQAYVRATRSLVDQPESEAAAGVSARLIKNLPIRLAAELRAIDNPFGTDIRPAAYAISEVPPLSLPLDLSGELYAAGGYVGGDADTFFADGQTTITRKVANFDLQKADDLRVSVGAGAWGGAQRGVHRLDVGPTLRLDMAIGEMPARVSIDYRERVGGDATPVSGLAATVSTRF